MKKQVLLLSSVLIFVVLVLVGQPAFQWGNAALYGIVAFSLAVPCVCFVDHSRGGYASPLIRQAKIQVMSAVALLLILFAGVFISSLNATDRAALSGVMKVSTSSGLPALDELQVPLVSKQVALDAMQRKLGEDLGLGSQFEVGNTSKQVHGDRLVWVAPLEPRSWLKAMFGDAAPGYMVVDASDPSSAKLVKSLVQISNRQFFGLGIRVWAKNPTLNPYAWYFELDESGNAFWVAPLVERKVGFKGQDVVGVVIFNAATSVQTRYSLNNVPDWVDHRFPASLLKDQVNTAGDLVNGWWNPTDEGKFQLSTDLDFVYAEGQPWFIGTLSGVARDESITEGMLIHARTKEIKRFTMQGITEVSAARALEGQNPEKKLVASNPIPYLVGGTPAYVAALADSRSIVRAYGIVAVADAQVLAVADTLNAAVKQFSTKQGRATADFGGVAEIEDVSGSILTIRQDSSSGQYFMLVLVEGKKRFFVAAPHLNDELHVTQKDDLVKLSVKKAGQQTSVVTAFDNMGI